MYVSDQAPNQSQTLFCQANYCVSLRGFEPTRVKALECFYFATYGYDHVLYNFVPDFCFDSYVIGI